MVNFWKIYRSMYREIDTFIPKWRRKTVMAYQIIGNSTVCNRLTTKTSNLHITGHLWPVVGPHKRPVMRKAVHDVIITQKYGIESNGV